MFNSGNCSVPLVASLDGGCNNGNNGFAGGWDAWIVIILFALIFGWGNNGWGNNGGNGGGNAQFIPYQVGSTYTDAAIQRGFDNQAVVQKLDGITQGICDSTYALNNTITNGFAGVNQALCNGFNNTNTAMLQGFNSTNVALMQGQNALQAQAADCCCTIERGIDGINYNNAMQTSALQNTMCNNTRDIIDSQNAGTRAVLDALTQQRLEAKDEKIAEQAQQITALQFAASQAQQNTFITANQEAQTAELIRRLGADCPIPAYVVPNPNCCYGNPIGVNYGNYGNGCGCNSGCGCA